MWLAAMVLWAPYRAFYLVWNRVQSPCPVLVVTCLQFHLSCNHLPTVSQLQCCPLRMRDTVRFLGLGLWTFALEASSVENALFILQWQWHFLTHLALQSDTLPLIQCCWWRSWEQSNGSQECWVAVGTAVFFPRVPALGRGRVSYL